MYRFIGYALRDDNGNIAQFFKTRFDAENVCRQHNLPLERAFQIYEFKQPNYDLTYAPTTPDLVDFC